MDNTKISITLRDLTRKMWRYIENDLHKKDIEKQVGVNSFIVGYIAENSGKDVYSRDIEREFGLTRSSISKVISLMEERGFLTMEHVDADRRLKKLVLTKKGKRVADVMNDDAKAVENKITNGFTPDELDTFRSYLNRMIRNVSQ